MSQSLKQSKRFETLYQNCKVATLFLWLGGMFLMLSREIDLFNTSFLIWVSAFSAAAASRMIACRVLTWKKNEERFSWVVVIASIVMWAHVSLIPLFAPESAYSNEVTYLFLLVSSISASVIFYSIPWMVWIKNGFVFLSLTYLLFSATGAVGMSEEMFWIKAGLVPVLIGFNLKLSQNFFEAKKRNDQVIESLYNQTAEMSTKAEDLEEASYFKEYLVEATEAASKAKTVFLANISHEIRTPLNAVIGFSQVLKEDKSMPEQYQENLKRISLNAQHLLVLINDVLDMSKIEAGKLELEPETVELHKLLENIIEFIVSRADDKGIELSVEIDPEVPEVSKLDPLKLRQVLINLLGNAIKFTEEGGVKLYARPGSEEGEVEFGVQDSGVGIAPEDQKRLFQEFEQLTNSKGLEGTGLGLTISSRIIALMGGKLKVHSVFGEGSCFYFSVPLERLQQESSRAELVAASVSADIDCPDSNRSNEISVKNARVLIVDDIQSNRLLLMTALKSLELNVFEAVDGKDAFEVWQQERPDLILMDRRMPKIDGVEATRMILEDAEKAGLSSPVVIAVTADVIGKCTAEQWPGISGFIPKPFDIREIRQTVTSSLLSKGDLEDPVVLPR